MVFYDRNRLPNELFDILHIFFFFDIAEGDGPSSETGPSGPSDSMDIGFRNVWQIIVDHTGKLLDVNASGCDVSGYQHLDFPGFKLIERFLTRALGFVTVNCGGVYFVFRQKFGYPVGAVLGAGKDQGRGDGLALQQVN